MKDKDLLKRALKLAKKGRGWVSPNPLVGAVIVKNGQIVGEGYHQRFGGDHAEVNALRVAGKMAEGAALYVNLEPCCHFGKTPPCVDRIIEAGIQQVVIGTQDPNPLVNGKGIALLKSKGIEVQVGLLEEECRRLNEAYFKHIVTGLPLVTLKVAQSLDGRIATKEGRSQWITSHRSRVLSHRLRRDHDAVLVGINTVLVDDPQLTVRHVRGPNPRRIVLDSRLRIPLTSRLLSDAWVEKTIIVTTPEASEKTIQDIQQRGAQVWVIKSNEERQVDLRDLLTKMGQTGIASVLIEGGGQVFTSMLRAGLADRIFIFMAPILLGKGIEAVGELGIKELEKSLKLSDVKLRRIGSDFLIEGGIW